MNAVALRSHGAFLLSACFISGETVTLKHPADLSHTSIKCNLTLVKVSEVGRGKTAVGTASEIHFC